jgi:mitogen-activated protein kinase kinase kinase 5
LLLSPDIESPKDSSEQDGFYLLKKDSQRRTTLTRVLAQDEKKICDVWLKSIESDVENTVLTMVLAKLITSVQKLILSFVAESSLSAHERLPGVFP